MSHRRQPFVRKGSLRRTLRNGVDTEEKSVLSDAAPAERLTLIWHGGPDDFMSRALLKTMPHEILKLYELR